MTEPTQIEQPQEQVFIKLLQQVKEQLDEQKQINQNLNSKIEVLEKTNQELTANLDATFKGIKKDFSDIGDYLNKLQTPQQPTQQAAPQQQGKGVFDTILNLADKAFNGSGAAGTNPQGLTPMQKLILDGAEKTQLLYVRMGQAQAMKAARAAGVPDALLETAEHLTT